MKPVSLNDFARLEQKSSIFHVDLSQRDEDVSNEDLLVPDLWSSIGDRVSGGDQLRVKLRGGRQVELNVLRSYQTNGLVVEVASQSAAQAQQHIVICRTAPTVFELREVRNGKITVLSGRRSNNLEVLVRSVADMFQGKDGSNWPDLTISHRSPGEIEDDGVHTLDQWLNLKGEPDTVTVYAPDGHGGDFWGSISGHSHGLTNARILFGSTNRFVTSRLADTLLMAFNAGQSLVVGQEPRWKQYGHGFTGDFWVRPRLRCCDVLSKSFPSPKEARDVSRADQELCDLANTPHVFGHLQAVKTVRSRGWHFDKDRFGRSIYEVPGTPEKDLVTLANYPWLLGSENASRKLLARGWTREQIIPSDGAPRRWRHYDPNVDQGASGE